MDLQQMISRTLSCVSSTRDELELLKDELELLKDFCYSEALKWVSLQIRDMLFLRTFLFCARKWGIQHVVDSRGSLSVQLWNFVVRKTFHLCARNWGKQHVTSGSLGALLLSIEDAVSRMTEEIHSFRLSSPRERFSRNYRIQQDSVREIRSLKDEIHRSYIEIFSRWRSSDFSLVNEDEVFDVLDSILEMLSYLSTRQRQNLELVKDTKALAEKLTFLRNFLHFTTLLEVDGDWFWRLLLLTKIERVLLNVAREATVFYGFLRYCDVPQIKRDDYHKLLQSIVPVKTCQELIASCLSRKAHRDLDDHLLREIVDVLLISLWDMIQSGTCRVIHQRDQLQKLYEWLRSIRKILLIKPNQFDEKLRDLSGDVVNETGLTIFSISLDAVNDGLEEEMDLVSFDLLEKFKVIQAKIAEKFPERSSFNFPRTNELGFVDFLLNYMMDLTNSKIDSRALVKYPIQTIYDELSFLRSNLLRQIMELRNEAEEFQSLWDRIMEVAYKVEFLIDSLLVGHILNSTSTSFDSILEEIKIIKAEALNFDSKGFNLKVDELTKKFDHIPSDGNKRMVIEVVVGLEDEARSIINRLTRGSQQLKIVPIIGMPGLGKTTLAKKVFNDIAIVNYFHARSWCTVSQSHQKKNLLLEVLTCINANNHEKFLNMSEEDLAHEVKKSLLRKKYLIVLDDVWDIEAWNGLQASFPDDGNGSRVIMTSRLRDIAPEDRLEKEPHSLRELTPDESWDLLKQKLCPGQAIIPPELCELRKEIVELCQGLPLTVVIVAGVLANMDQSCWKESVRSLSLGNISSSEQCAAALELSYRHLPDNIKPCFLYFGGFPEDHEHAVKRLIRLWVAERFAQTTHTRSAEDVANDYLMNLISRSLVMVSEETSIGGVKTCRIHDLLHEFCVSKAKVENFMQFVCGYDELHTLYVPHHMRRLCISSEAEHFEESRLSFPTLRTLLFFGLGPTDVSTVFDLSFVCQAFKLLRVLVLCQIHPQHSFYAEMGLLTELRYLEIVCHGDCIPSSIASLSNLETLIIDNPFGHSFYLPETIWNMKKLRHLLLKEDEIKGGCLYLPAKNLDKSLDLSDLDTFSTAKFFSWEEANKILRKFPNVRKLKLKFQVPESPKIIFLNSSCKLKSLNLDFSNFIRSRHYYFDLEFHFCETLEKLTLSGSGLPWTHISVVANLPNLRVLKLIKGAFRGETWSMEGEKFPNLEFLKLDGLDIEEWTALDFEDSFPCLKKLVLNGCWDLKEIPSSMGDVSTLEMIEVYDCPCASSLEKIKEEYIDLKIMYKECPWIEEIEEAEESF